MAARPPDDEHQHGHDKAAAGDPVSKLKRGGRSRQLDGSLNAAAGRLAHARLGLVGGKKGVGGA